MIPYREHFQRFPGIFTRFAGAVGQVTGRAIRESEAQFLADEMVRGRSPDALVARILSEGYGWILEPNDSIWRTPDAVSPQADVAAGLAANAAVIAAEQERQRVAADLAEQERQRQVELAAEAERQRIIGEQEQVARWAREAAERDAIMGAERERLARAEVERLALAEAAKRAVYFYLTDEEYSLMQSDPEGFASYSREKEARAHGFASYAEWDAEREAEAERQRVAYMAPRLAAQARAERIDTLYAQLNQAIVSGEWGLAESLSGQLVALSQSANALVIGHQQEVALAGQEANRLRLERERTAILSRQADEREANDREHDAILARERLQGIVRDPVTFEVLVDPTTGWGATPELRAEAINVATARKGGSLAIKRPDESGGILTAAGIGLALLFL